jgi:hypothetical protein
MHRHQDIAETFRRHYAYYGKIGDETRRQQLEAERSIRREYGGRTTFELLQNAFDRAERHVLVAVVDSTSGQACLIVGNDGMALSVSAAFDYEKTSPAWATAVRSDFHAICSLHTSSKKADESIDNKGVGFRSVFALAPYVQVISRVPDTGDWWGIELHWCLTRQKAEQRLGEATWLEPTPGPRRIWHGRSFCLFK